MSHKGEEKIIGEIFIKEYNAVNHCNFRFDENYLLNRKDNAFPDLRFINEEHLLAEVGRAVSEDIEKEKYNYSNSELIEVDPSAELFFILNKKKEKHYSGVEEIILLIWLPFYADQSDISYLAPAVKKRGYKFKEIWAVWDDRSKKPLKLG